MDDELSNLEDLIDVIRSALDDLAEKLEDQGADAAAIDFALFEAFSDRMIFREGESSWRTVLSSALDEPVEKQTIH
jgi:predicted  nucleic acid-binding Zn-ribbon protein